MSNPHLVLCNGSPPGARRPREWAGAPVTSLSTIPGKSNVNLRITDITDRMAKALPDVIHDLIEFSALIYAADQSCKRSGGKTIDYGAKWHRSFRFEVAVRNPDFWNSDEVRAALEEGLHFLSFDNYEFQFTKLADPPPPDAYLEFKRNQPDPKPVERVMLFSGGLDSLAGAVDEIITRRRRVALVSHKPVDHLAVRQRELVADIRKRAGDARLSPLHFPVLANKAGELSLEYTQRTRSFLYASMATAVATHFGLDEIHFFENGVVSVNLPLCSQEVGSRATRTTHPQTLHAYERIFQLVLKRKFRVHNDFAWMTKEDVLHSLKNSGHVELAKQSLSCTHTRNFTLKSPHCGLCSQCLSRRMASLGADYGDCDPATGYRADPLLGDRLKAEDRILAERFVGSALQIEEMTSSDEFNTAFAGELARVYPYLGTTNEDAAARLFDLHHRHATQVGKVVTGQIREHADAWRRGRLPQTCALAFACARGSPAPSLSDGEYVPSGDARLLLSILSTATQLMGRSNLRAATAERDHRISEKTIGKVLCLLEQRSLIEFPEGRKKGAKITAEGRSLLALPVIASR